MRLSNDSEHVQLQLSADEAYSLISILLTAKFPDGVRIEVTTHQLINEIIAGLHRARHEMGQETRPTIGSDILGGKRGPPPISFLSIANQLKSLVEEEKFEQALAEAIYPWAWKDYKRRDFYIDAGTLVALDGETTSEGQPVHGLVVGCGRATDAVPWECQVVLLDEVSWPLAGPKEPRIVQRLSEHLTVLG